jgi:anti-sigma factor RsiW
MNECTYCQSALIAYIDGELSRREARRVAAHLHSCDGCYRAYITRRDATRDIERDLSLLGTADAPQLDSIWTAVQSEIKERTPTRQHPRRDNWERAMVGAAFAVLCALPWTLTTDNMIASAAMPVGVTPVEMPAGTPEGTRATSTRVAARTLPTEDAGPPTPTSTPAVAPAPYQTQ